MERDPSEDHALRAYQLISLNYPSRCSQMHKGGESRVLIRRPLTLGGMDFEIWHRNRSEIRKMRNLQILEVRKHHKLNNTIRKGEQKLKNLLRSEK